MEKQSAVPWARRWAVPMAVLGMAAVLMAVVLFQQSSDDGEPAGASEGHADVEVEEQRGESGEGALDLREVERRDPDDLLAAGDPNAPVGLVVFSDYQCPFCGSWSQDTLPELQSYVDAGELRVEWRDVNVFGEVSERAARASYAAGLQDGFWEYHHALFPEGETLPESDLTEDALVSLAEELDLDPEQFAADMEADETRTQITENARLGLELGAHSTPSFLLDGEPIAGAQPTEVFVDAVDAALDNGGE